MTQLMMLTVLACCAALAGQVALKAQNWAAWTVGVFDAPPLLITSMMVGSQRKVVFCLGAFLLLCLVLPTLQSWWTERNRRVGSN